MDPKLTETALSLIQSEEDSLTACLRTFLQRGATDPLRALVIEVLPDQFDLNARLFYEEGTPETLELTENASTHAFNPLSDFLDAIPEPTTRAGFAELEELYKNVYTAFLALLHKVFMELDGPSVVQAAFALIRDDEDALNLTTGELVPVDETYFDDSSGILNPPSEIAYTQVKESEALGLPHFFGRKEFNFKDDLLVQAELKRASDYIRNCFLDIEPKVRESINAFTACTALPVGTLFLDLDLTLSDPVRLRCLPITQSIREAPAGHGGTEISLGTRNAFAEVSLVMTQMFIRLFKTPVGSGILDQVQLEYTALAEALILKAFAETKTLAWQIPIFLRDPCVGFYLNPTVPSERFQFKKLRAAFLALK